MSLRIVLQYTLMGSTCDKQPHETELSQVNM